MSERTWSKLGALAATIVLLVVTFSGGFATYAAFSDTETVGVSFGAAGNIAPATPANVPTPASTGGFGAQSVAEDETTTQTTTETTTQTTTTPTTTQTTTETTTQTTTTPTTTTTQQADNTTTEDDTTTTTTTGQCDGGNNVSTGDGTTDDGSCGQQSIGGPSDYLVAVPPQR